MIASRPLPFRAVVFDLDGVVVDTARVHAAAWKQMFDDFLGQRATGTGEPFRPFSVEHDYLVYVDGKPRYDGVRSFLASRGIRLPEGTPDDPPDRETVCGLGNRKNRLFVERLRRDGARAFPGTVTLIEGLKERGARVGLISASRNLPDVVRAAGVGELFDAVVDGNEAARRHLKGKPEPDIFLACAGLLGAEPASAIVVEDAVAGVAAGHKGGFGLVVGVDRGHHGAALRDAGADVVVGDLGETGPDDLAAAFTLARRERPSALARWPEIAARLEGAVPVLLLDFDGTLAPIVSRPDLAEIPAPTRAVLSRLATRVPLAVISGRALDDLVARVGVDGLIYAGAHGFEIVRGTTRHEMGAEFRDDIAAAAAELGSALEGIAGVIIENKRYAVAVHYRLAAEDDVEKVEATVSRIARAHPRLRLSLGKKVFEIRPAMAWDKGKAALWILERFGLDRAGRLPIYIGDDTTDEDAFRALADRGIGILVGAGWRVSAARYVLAGPDEVRAFLGRIAGLVEETAA